MRLTDHADDVLVGVEVHAVFAADRRIHLREERGRDEAETHAALVDGGRESSDVGGDPAAHAEYKRLSVSAFLQQPLLDLQQRGKSLPFLRRLDREYSFRFNVKPFHDATHIAVVDYEYASVASEVCLDFAQRASDDVDSLHLL